MRSAFIYILIAFAVSLPAQTQKQAQPNYMWSHTKDPKATSLEAPKGYTTTVPVVEDAETERKKYLNDNWAFYLLRWGHYEHNQVIAALYLGELCERKDCGHNSVDALSYMAFNTKASDIVRITSIISLGRASKYHPDQGYVGSGSIKTCLLTLAKRKDESYKIRNSAVMALNFVPEVSESLIEYHKSLESNRTLISYDTTSDTARLEINTLYSLYAMGRIDYLQSITVKGLRRGSNFEGTDETSMYTSDLLLARYLSEDAPASKRNFSITVPKVLADLAQIQTDGRFDQKTQEFALSAYNVIKYDSKNPIGVNPIKGLYIPTDKDLAIESALNTTARITEFVVNVYFIASAIREIPSMIRLIQSVFRSGEYAIKPVFEVVAYDLRPIYKVSTEEVLATGAFGGDAAPALMEEAVAESKIVERLDNTIYKTPKDNPLYKTQSEVIAFATDLKGPKVTSKDFPIIDETPPFYEGDNLFGGGGRTVNPKPNTPTGGSGFRPKTDVDVMVMESNPSVTKVVNGKTYQSLDGGKTYTELGYGNGLTRFTENPLTKQMEPVYPVSPIAPMPAQKREAPLYNIKNSVAEPGENSVDAQGETDDENLNKEVRSPDLSTRIGRISFCASIKHLHPHIYEGGGDRYEILENATIALKELGQYGSVIEFGKVTRATHEYTNKGEVVYDKKRLDQLKEDINSSLEYLKKRISDFKLKSLKDDLTDLSSRKDLDLSHYLKLVPFIYNGDGTPVFETIDVASLHDNIRNATVVDMETKYKDLFKIHQTGIILGVNNQNVQGKYNQIKNKFLQSELFVKAISPFSTVTGQNIQKQLFTLEEIPPLVAVFRSGFGTDCSSRTIPNYVLIKGVKTYIIRKNNKSDVSGYVLVAPAKLGVRTLPYVVTINGNFTDVDAREIIYTIGNIWNSEEVLVPNFAESMNPNVVNTDQIKMGMYDFENKKAVKSIIMPKGWDKQGLMAPDGSNYYSNSNLKNGYLLKLSRKANVAISSIQTPYQQLDLKILSLKDRIMLVPDMISSGVTKNEIMDILNITEEHFVLGKPILDRAIYSPETYIELKTTIGFGIEDIMLFPRGRAEACIFSLYEHKGELDIKDAQWDKAFKQLSKPLIDDILDKDESLHNSTLEELLEFPYKYWYETVNSSSKISSEVLRDLLLHDGYSDNFIMGFIEHPDEVIELLGCSNRYVSFQTTSAMAEKIINLEYYTEVSDFIKSLIIEPSKISKYDLFMDHLRADLLKIDTEIEERYIPDSFDDDEYSNEEFSKLEQQRIEEEDLSAFIGQLAEAEESGKSYDAFNNDDIISPTTKGAYKIESPKDILNKAALVSQLRGVLAKYTGYSEQSDFYALIAETVERVNLEIETTGQLSESSKGMFEGDYGKVFKAYEKELKEDDLSLDKIRSKIKI